MTFRRLVQKLFKLDVATASGRAVTEERYWSLRRQVPIVYLLGLVNLSAMELASTGKLAFGLNLPTFIATCGIVRLVQWFGSGKEVSHRVMVRRMRQTVFFATLVCLAVCARCLFLLQDGDMASRMSVMLFGGLTAIGVAYGLTALPAAARVPLILIIVPISAAAVLSREPHFAGAAFGLVMVAILTMRLLEAHSRHFTDVIRSRAAVVRERQRVESAHLEAVAAATTDFMTGLPNRRAFVAALDMACAEFGSGEPFAVAILDLDRFKTANDTFGHAVGDQLLREVARRLVETVGEGGIVARLGGDEFGVLLPGIASPKQARSVGEQILHKVNGPAILFGREHVISACCGLGLSGLRKENSPSRIMADADLALYQAKDGVGSRFALFELAMEAPRRRRIEIEAALMKSAVYESLGLVFQPIFDLRSGRVIAHEALARWTDPELGPVPPSEFVPIAEQMEIIDDINNHLMSIAFTQAREWPASIKLSFNLSAVQLGSHGSARQILKALRSAGLSPDRLQVEVTETALLANFERARENLDRLRLAGATIVLDDFGAGFASIGYLRELRFDQIKLDGGLVTAAQQSLDGKRLLSAVISLCEILGVSSVAEHVESEDLLRLVSELGCTGGQGFWLKRPLAADQLHELHQPISEVRRLPSRRAA